MNRFFPLVAVCFLSACSAVTTIDEYRVNNSAMELNSNESVVILGRRDAGHYDTDREFIGCVADKMQGADISIMPEQQFVDAFYPWFEPRTAPKGLARLKRLMQDTTMDSDGKHVGLGDVPLLNTFFKQEKRVSTKTELVILLRPIVVGDGDWQNAVQDSQQSIKRLGKHYQQDFR